MPAKTPFTPKQHDLLLRVVQEAVKDKKRFKNQEQLALAIGITQPSLSAYMKGKWKPGVKIARAIAHLDGQTLEDLVGPFATAADEPTPKKGRAASASRYPNLETCIEFHASTREWSPWVLAAARAGYFGPEDFVAPKWPEKLDSLEKIMQSARKGG